MPGPVAIASNPSAPNRFSVRFLFSYNIGVKMLLVLGHTDILQILNGIVAFVKIFVVYIGSIRWWWPQERQSHQAMNEMLLRKYLGLIVPHLAQRAFVNRPPLRGYATQGTHLSPWHFRKMNRIQHWPPLLPIQGCLANVLESHFKTAYWRQAPAAVRDSGVRYAKLFCC